MKAASTRNPSLAAELIEGFSELATALETGKVSEQFNLYRVRLDLSPGEYTPEKVKEVRSLLRASQSVFAKFLGASTSTVRQWEQGTALPQPIACRFMDEISFNPTYYLKRLQRSIVRKPRKASKPVR